MNFSEQQKDILLDKYGEYPIAAYEFVADATSECVSRLEKPRHVSAAELVDFLRDYAVSQFGVMAFSVLNSWNLCSPSDIGRVVYRLISMGILSASKEDNPADFEFHATLIATPSLRRRKKLALPRMD